MSHHLAAIRDADHILVFDDGYLAGDGRHDVRLKECRRYSSLWMHYTLNLEATGLLVVCSTSCSPICKSAHSHSGCSASLRVKPSAVSS